MFIDDNNENMKIGGVKIIYRDNITLKRLNILLCTCSTCVS